MIACFNVSRSPHADEVSPGNGSIVAGELTKSATLRIEDSRTEDSVLVRVFRRNEARQRDFLVTCVTRSSGEQGFGPVPERRRGIDIK